MSGSLVRSPARYILPPHGRIAHSKLLIVEDVRHFGADPDDSSQTERRQAVVVDLVAI
jgi:hypothetical protein